MRVVSSQRQCLLSNILSQTIGKLRAFGDQNFSHSCNLRSSGSRRRTVVTSN
jgi:hypothetical protein